MRQVTRPNSRAAIAQADVDADGDVVALQVRGDWCFVIAFNRQTLIGDLCGAKADGEQIALGAVSATAHKGIFTQLSEGVKGLREIFCVAHARARRAHDVSKRRPAGAEAANVDGGWDR